MVAKIATCVKNTHRPYPQVHPYSVSCKHPVHFLLDNWFTIIYHFVLLTFVELEPWAVCSDYEWFVLLMESQKDETLWV